MNNKNKIVIDLCGGTGAWSAPYKEAGYDVRVITLPEYDVLKLDFEGDGLDYKGKFLANTDDIYGVLAAPPCTMFSDARTNAKEPRNLRSGMEVVQKCIDIITELQYRTKSDQQKMSPLKFWALENPWYGRLKWFLGKPVYTFSPYNFGEPYQKRTALWGYFNEPRKIYFEASSVMSDEQMKKAKSNSQKLPQFTISNKRTYPEAFRKLSRRDRRAITPKGFADAFFASNK